MVRTLLQGIDIRRVDQNGDNDCLNNRDKQLPPQFAIYKFEMFLQYTSNNSGENVNFVSANFTCTGMRNSCNILVNKSGEKVNFFSASF